MRSATRAALALAATASLTLTAMATGPTAVARKATGGGPAEGAGRVFMVNPVQSSVDVERGQGLTDQKDSASAVEASDYASVPLTHLDGSGYLSGDYVTIQSSTGKAAFSTTGDHSYDRNDDRFEEVMAYYWITRTQTYLQSLGFGDDLPAVMDEQIEVKVNQLGGDNSYHTDKPFRIRFGKGGVDDAEDAEVIVHEYGHAIQADQVPGFGASLDARTIGEGFSDYLAISVGLDAAADLGWPVRGQTPREAPRGWDAEACFADWDATSISQGGAATCLRRLDQDHRTVRPRTGDPYMDSMIWSGALWRIRQDYEALGLGSWAWDRTLIDAQFDFAPDTSFEAAAQVVYQRAAASGPDAQAAVQARFGDRGIAVG